jgi:hypothetical protein
MGDAHRFDTRECPLLTQSRHCSAAGFVNTKDDQNDRGRREHPARMATARRPKVGGSAKQIEAANKQASRETDRAESDHKPLDQNAVKHRHAASYDTGHP